MFVCRNHPGHFFQEETQVHEKSTQHLSPERPNKRHSYPHLAVILQPCGNGCHYEAQPDVYFLKERYWGTLLVTVGCVLLTGL